MRNSSDNLDTSSFEIYKFGNCYLNKTERKVFRDNQHLEIASKAFDILQILVEKQGEVVTKDEILDRVWDDSFVEEGNLTVYVSKLRKLLHADKSEPFIETVSGVGYRFVSRVQPYSLDEWENLNNEKGKPLFNNETNISNDNSIAILPLKNENGDEEMDYLADGITESLINNLSYIPNLRVIARNTVFRYKDKDVDLKKIGAELDVKNILTGRIRIIRENLTIGVELTNTTDGTQIWGTQLNSSFDDIFQVQENITKVITESLVKKINNYEVINSSKAQTQNFESYRLYLKGLYFLNNRSSINLQKALSCFQNSISNDPTNVNSYLGIADCFKGFHSYDEITYKEAKNRTSSILQKVQEITDNTTSEFHIISGYMKMFLDFNITDAKKHFETAIYLNPNSIDARFNYSRLLAFCGDLAGALFQIKLIMKLDPISLSTNKSIAKIFYLTDQYENAIEKLEECLDLKPTDFEALLLLGTNWVEIKQFDETLFLFDKVLDIQFHTETLSMIGYTNALAGNISEAKQILKRLKKHSKKELVPSTYFAIIFSALKDNNKVFQYLEKAINERNTDVMALKVDPRYKHVRLDPRFNKLLKTIGLPSD